jgi:cation transport regulator ChaB
MEAAAEVIKTIAPGLSWEKIKNDIGEELKHQLSAGAHEVAAALFNGSAFVMYQRQGHDDPQQEHQEEVDHGMSM